MKNLLIPTDFSIYSIYAIKTGAKIAKKYNYSITLIHMLELPKGYSNCVNSTNQLLFKLKHTQNKFNEIIESDFLKGVIVNIIIKHYTVFPELVEIAKQYNSTLIIMGSNGRQNEDIPHIGSNTEEVVKNSKIPVLVIKEELKNIDFDNPVFVSDFKIENAPAYKKLKMFYDEIGVSPKMLFINIPKNGFVSSKEMRRRFVDFLIKAEGNLKNIKNFVNYDDYNVEDGAINYTKENKSSLISIATHGVTGLASLFHHSRSLGITNKTKLPILTALI